MLRVSSSLALTFTLALGLLSPVAYARHAAATALTTIRLPLGYIPNVQFAPFYVAIANGYFADEGIKINFDYSFDVNGVALTGAGAVSFAVATGDQVLLARAQGLPVVYVFATYQQYPVSVMAKTTEHVHGPADLRGKKIGLPALIGAPYIGLQALLFSAGLTTNDVTLESIGYSQVEALATNREDAVVGYSNNEPIQLRARGYKITELRVADYAQLAADGIITNEMTIAKNPGLVRGMVRAMARGVAYTIAHPDQAYAICMKYVPDLAQADQKVQKQVLKTSIGFWRAPRIGFSQAPAWTKMNALLLKMGLLTKPLDVSSAFTNQFVP
jgi:NitT/TauT family transport system substrate-binding protein